jgi:hypothetical protein
VLLLHTYVWRITPASPASSQASTDETMGERLSLRSPGAPGPRRLGGASLAEPFRSVQATSREASSAGTPKMLWLK